ncbi:ribonuclease III [Defluviitalea saccharophila]|uniref:Ribonuclease 3 n=1 Tax=Defluviitalea saccharophila TaxID=879970 RepID=A0ABZ2Y635_9FIRM|nr:ribonuclease III [Candidatus Epulonipiscium sp.]
MKKSNPRKIEDLEKIIGYSFKNENWIMEALTHSSYSNESKKHNLPNNERLEFLGDAILDLIISDYIFHKYPYMPEGELTKLRASIVCEPSLADAALKIHLGDFIYLGKGEELSGGRERVSILADTFEALLGAIYLDGKMESAIEFVQRILIPSIEFIKNNNMYMDYKTLLQEKIQKTSSSPIDYHTINETGPDHNKEFFVEVRHNGAVLGQGKGRSKKEAEQNAAFNALHSFMR